MKQEFDLIAELRDDQGKGASRRLRHQDKVPAILYGGGRPPRALSFDHNEIVKQMENEAFYSSVLTVKVDDKSQQAIVKDVQRHPSQRKILHLDLQRIVEDAEIRMNVPLHFVGDDVAPGVKAGGSVSRLMNDVEVVCLPKHLPEYFEIDVSKLELDEMLHLSDIQLPEGVQIVGLMHGEGHDQPIVSIHYVKAAPIEEPTEEGAAEAEPEAGEVPTVSDEEETDESKED